MLKKIILFVLLLGVSSFAQTLDWNRVSKEAISQKKLILISVESEGCHYCEKMNNEVFTPSKYTKKIDEKYLHKIVKIDNVKLPRSIVDVKFFPSNYILNPKNMKIIDEFPGYMKADDFISLLDLIYEQENSIIF